MEISKIYNYIRGYVSIEVTGLFTERFVNMCTSRGICLWDIEKTDDKKITACISIKGFKMLIPIAKKSLCSVHIREKCGLPFLLHRYRKRKAFAVGIVLCVLLLYYMTTFIWVIELNGNEEIKSEEILTTLSEAGIKPGIWKNSIDTDEAKAYVMTKMPEIAYISFTTKGTAVIVDVRERVKLPETFDKDEPCHITATNDGIITGYSVISGNPIVKVNDVVYKGQILVSGVGDSLVEGITFSHSEGQVFARVWHEEYMDLPAYDEKKIKTGKKKAKHGLKFFDLYVKLYIDDKVAFENYERVSYVKNASLGNNNKLPFSFHYDMYYELEVSKTELTPKQAQEKFKKQLDEKYKNTEIINREFTVYDNKIKAIYECIEDIGEKSPILYEEESNGTDGENAGS